LTADDVAVVVQMIEIDQMYRAVLAGENITIAKTELLFLLI